jgi:S1-C subfamily serine protease
MHWTAGVTALLATASLGGVGTALAVEHGGATRTVVERAPAQAFPAASTSSASVGDIYDRVRDGVVEIEVTSRSSGSGAFGQGSPFGDGSQQAQGSGFVIDRQGDIVTNDHVVEGASSISVVMADGSRYAAKLVGRDASTDVAVIRLSGSHPTLDPLTFADSSSVHVGDAVIAIGSPYGLQETVTTGIVSALGRDIQSPNGSTISGAIQTDAAINSGNSGGPLLDASGEPVGAGIVRVEQGSPAADAGLRGATGTTTVAGEQVRTGGDVITALDGTRVGSASALRTLVDQHAPGDEVTLTVSRGGRTETVRVTLASRS